MRVYDVVMTHKLDADDFFIHRVQKYCAERRLNFFLVEPLWVDSFLEKMRNGDLWARVLINLHSEHHQPADPFHQLVRLAFEQKTQVIDPPDLALAAFNKASLHPRLLAAGFNVPYSIIIPREKAGQFQLSALDLANLGRPFVIKPALGYGKRGVLLDAQGPQDLARSIEAWPDSHYLLQRRVTPRMLGDAPAYFRLFHAFGSLWFCWWNCYSDQYRFLTPEEMDAHGLAPLREIALRLADLTGIGFFSSEVAVTDSGEFVLIDYLNDQCHMLTQSSNPRIGVPDEVVDGIAARLVEKSAEMILEHSQPPALTSG